MDSDSSWRNRLESLDDKSKDLLLGAFLSRRFATLPLWLSHPAYVTAFYGVLLSLVLIFPSLYGYGDSWLFQWLYESMLIFLVCLILGFLSLIIVSISKRYPVKPPRAILYPMPFIGIALHSLNVGDLFDISNTIVWFFLLSPGPIYVHLSWAPRWRLLNQFERGENPILNDDSVQEKTFDEETSNEWDEQLMEVVDEFSESE